MDPADLRTGSKKDVAVHGVGTANFRYASFLDYVYKQYRRDLQEAVKVEGKCRMPDRGNNKLSFVKEWHFCGASGGVPFALKAEAPESAGKCHGSGSQTLGNQMALS